MIICSHWYDIFYNNIPHQQRARLTFRKKSSMIQDIGQDITDIIKINLGLFAFCHDTTITLLKGGMYFIIFKIMLMNHIWHNSK